MSNSHLHAMLRHLPIATIILFLQASAQAVPPTIIPGQELIIIERTREPADTTSANTAQAQIDRLLADQPLPPLHVHPNYYSRDLSYQWKAIPRGRVLIVARHPKTGERQFAEAVLPNGSPIIEYRHDSITYLYEQAEERVIVHFSLFGNKPPRVTHRKGKGALRTIHDSVADIRSRARAFAGRVPLFGTLRENTGKVKDTAKGAATLGGGAADRYMTTVGRLLDNLPGLSQLQSLGKQSGERGRLEEIRQAGNRASRDASDFVRTVR